MYVCKSDQLITVPQCIHRKQSKVYHYGLSKIAKIIIFAMEQNEAQKVKMQIVSFCGILTKKQWEI